MTKSRGVALIGAALAIVGVVALTQAPPRGSDSGPDELEGPQEASAVSVTRGTVRSVVVLDGVVVPAAPQLIKATTLGVLQDVQTELDQRVVAGQALGSLRGGDDGATVSIVSPVAGAIQSWVVGTGERLRAGDVIATVDPGSFDGEAVISPELLYRFYGRSSSITAKLDKGPAPFDCPFLSLGAPISGREADAAAVPVRLRCSIPAGIRVFPGVRMKLAAVTGESRGALLLPLQAVSGEADRGSVTVVDQQGRSSPRDVRLGLTDGINIEIISGLAEGDRVLIPPLDEPDAVGP